MFCDVAGLLRNTSGSIFEDLLAQTMIRLRNTRPEVRSFLLFCPMPCGSWFSSLVLRVLGSVTSAPLCLFPQLPVLSSERELLSTQENPQADPLQISRLLFSFLLSGTLPCELHLPLVSWTRSSISSTQGVS